MELFISSRKIHGCEDFYAFLDQVNSKEGKLLLLLGGKSVGQSMVLADLEKQLNDKGVFALLVNARSFAGEPLSTGILSAYKAYFTRRWAVCQQNRKQFGC